MNTKEFLLSAWNWHPAVLGACVAAIVAYVLVCRSVSKSQSGPPSVFRLGSFAFAIVVFLVTLVSPLDALADGYLFSAHMLQHLLLLLVVPALVLLALPASIEGGERRGALTGPLATRPGHRKLATFVAWLAGVGSMWLWHVPTLCNAATGIRAVRDIQIVSLLALGALFWWPILGLRPRRRLSPLAGIAYLFTACVGCTLLGIIITFAPVSVCPIYQHPVDRLGVLSLIRDVWGFTPSVNQEVGGLIMWVPACFIYLSGIMALLGRWYAGSEPGHLENSNPSSSHA